MKSCLVIGGIILVLLIGACLLIPSCCAESKTIEGKTYSAYGFFNKDTQKNEQIEYEVSVGSVVIGCIFCETIIVPVYLAGWRLWQPVGKKITNPSEKGILN